MKKLLSLFLALVMALSLTVPTCAAYTPSKQESAQLLYNLGLFKGNGDLPDGTPTFELNRAPTRVEAVIILIRLLGAEEEALSRHYACPYTDVPDWASDYIGYAYRTRLSFGIRSDLFGASQSVTAAQFLTFVLRALGYTDGADFQWNSSWTLTDKLGITSGQYNAQTKTFLRGDAAAVSANALFATRKSDGMTMLDYLLSKDAISGESAVLWSCTPVTLEADYAAFLFYPVQGSPSTFTSFKVSKVTVNGKKCDVLQLTSPEAAASYLSSIGGDKGGFCYAELNFDKSAATTYKAPDGKSYPLLKFSFTYTGTQADGTKVSGSYTASYYLDGE